MKKKLIVMAVALISMFSFSAPVSATVDISQNNNKASFEIKDVVDYAQVYGIRGDTAITRIPVNLNISERLGTNLVVDIEPRSSASTSGTLNFTVSGNFYRTSDNETVTVYGLSGSFEYTGTDTKITGKDSYHNSTLEGWTGTSKTSTSKSEPYSISVLKGDYVLYQNGKQNNTSWIKIAVSESGQYSVGGDYVSYNVN